MKMKHLFAGLVATLALGAATTAGIFLANEASKEYKPAEAATKTVYFQDKGWWGKDNAYTAVYCWKTDGTAKVAWPGERMTLNYPASHQNSGGNVYKFSYDVATYPNLIFVRVNASGTVSDWGAKTVNLTSPTGTANYFTLGDTEVWGDPGATGTWKTPVSVGTYLRGSSIGWGEGDQIAMTATGNSNEYSITRNFAAGEEVKAVTYSSTIGAPETWVNVNSATSNHSVSYPVSINSGNAKVTNAGSYTLTINTSSKTYSFAANDFVTPVAQIAYSGGTNGESSSYNTTNQQSEILVYLNKDEAFTVKHVTSFGTFYRGYDNLEEGTNSSRTKGDVTKGSLKEGSTYYINVATSGLYLLYVKDSGSIWMQDAEPSPAAHNWATYFLANVGCDANGVNEPSGWTAVSNRYATLTDEAKALIVAADADENSLDEIEQAMARYDYAVTHHASLTRFVVGRTISNPSGSKTLSLNPTVEAAVPATVAVVGMVSMTAVGGFFFLKKKPFQSTTKLNN